MANTSGTHRPRGLGEIIKALRWSWQGLQAAWRHESSFRTEIYALLIFAPLALWLGHDGVERALLLGSCVLIVAAEILNSAIEAAIDRHGDERHELAGRAKDLGSAAVFVLILNMLAVWALVLWPHF